MAVQGGRFHETKNNTCTAHPLLSWNAAASFSWFGTKGVKKFSGLHLCKLMRGESGVASLISRSLCKILCLAVYSIPQLLSQNGPIIHTLLGLVMVFSLIF